LDLAEVYRVIEMLRLWHTLRIVAIMFVTTVIAFVALDAMDASIRIRRALQRIGRYLEKLALPPKAAIAIVAALFSPRAAHTVVATMYRRKEVSDKQVILFSLIAAPFSALNTVLRTTFPIALASLGPKYAAIYLAIALVPAATRFVMGLLYGVAVRRSMIASSTSIEDIVVMRSTHFNLKRSICRGIRVGYRLGIRILIALILINVLMALGILSYIATYLEPLAKVFGLSSTATAIFMIAALRPTLAIVALGDMLSRGVVTAVEGFTAIVLGHILFFLLIDTPRAILPLYTALYSLRIGLKVVLLILLSQAISLPIQLTIIGLLAP